MDKWSKIDRVGLAYHVHREAADLLPLGFNLLDLQMEDDGYRKIAENIYSALLKKELEYGLSGPSSSERGPEQQILTPREVLEERKRATCLDLALLFAGLCLGYELIPVLVVLEGHVVVAISLTHGERSWDRREIYEDTLFKGALVPEEKEEQLREVLTSGAYLILECTGFARSHSLSYLSPEGIGREPNGTMCFERAATAGSEQLELASRRSFKYALDIAVAQNFYNLKPAPMIFARSGTAKYIARGSSLQVEDNDGPLPYLLDRSQQEKALRRAALNHRAEAPCRPLLCLIHGDQYECHREFVLRLREISIPRILEYWNPEERQPLPMKYDVSLPSFIDVPSGDWKDAFWEELAKGTLKDPFAAVDQVISFISRHRPAVMIDIPILADLLKEDVENRITSIGEFWSGWPDMPEGLFLVICLSFKYQGKYETRKTWYRRRQSSAGLNDQIRECLARQRYRNKVESVCLPELRGITQREAEEAVNLPQVRTFYGLTESDIRNIYSTTDDSIPMDHLLRVLIKISGDRILRREYAE